MSAEDNLRRLGLTLPIGLTSLANYVPWRRAGDMLYLAGPGPRKPDGGWYIGQLGQNVTVSEGYEHARIAALALLGVARDVVGNLDGIEVIKVLGLVNAAPGFEEHPQVIDGCSDLFTAVLGEAGRHARSAIGVGSLPMNITVEIECVMHIRPG